MKARPFLDFVHADDVALTLAAAECLSRGEAQLTFENRYRHKDGSDVVAVLERRTARGPNLRIHSRRDRGQTAGRSPRQDRGGPSDNRRRWRPSDS